MAETKETIIIDVKVTEEKLGEVARSINDLKEANKELTKGMRLGKVDWTEGTKAVKENELQIKSLKAAEKELTGQLAITTAANRTYSDSNDGLRAQLGDLEKQYNSLTNAQKNDAGGKAMFESLTKLKATVKANAEEMGNFQDSVGNYEKGAKSLKAELKQIVYELAQMKLEGKENSDAYRNLAARGGELKDTLSDVATELKNTGSDTRGIDQVVGAFNAVGAAAQVAEGAAALFGAENEDVQRSIQKLVAIQSLMNGVQEIGNALQKESTFMMGVQAAKSKILAGWKITLTTLERIFGITAAEAMALATAGITVLISGIIILIANFGAIITSLKEFFGVTDEFKEVKKDIDANTAALDGFNDATARSVDRMKALGKTDQEILNERKKRFNEELRLNADTYNKIKKIGDDATDAQKEQLKKSYEFVKNAGNEIYKLNTEQIALDRKKREDDAKAQEDLNKKALDKQKQNTEKANKLREDSIKQATEMARQLEDAIIAAKKDGIEKQIEIESKATQRQIEELRNRKTLTEKEATDRDALITQLEANLTAKVAKMRSDATAEATQKAIADEQKRLELLLSVAVEGSKNELDLRLQVIENLRRQELANTELTEEQKTAINLKYNNQRSDAENQILAKQVATKKQILDNEFAAMRLKLDESYATQQQYADLELQQAQTTADNLINMDAATKAALYKSEEDYTAAVIAAKSAVVAANKNVQATELATLKMQADNAKAFGDVITSVLSEVAGDSKEAMVFMKLLALAQAGINLGVSISEATKGGAVAGPIGIATNVGAVLVAFAQVVKSIKAAQVPAAPKFSRGLLEGAVKGNPSTGDSVNAWLTPGERVLNKQQQDNLFRIIAEGGSFGGNQFDYALLAKAISNLPAPVMDYREFTIFREKIATFDEHTKI